MDSAIDLFESALLGGHHLLLLQLFLGDFLCSDVGGAWDGHFLLAQDDFHVARRGHVGVDATVRTVGSASLFSGGVNLQFKGCVSRNRNKKRKII